MREPVGRQQHPASMFARSWLVNRPSRLIRTTAGTMRQQGRCGGQQVPCLLISTQLDD